MTGQDRHIAEIRGEEHAHETATRRASALGREARRRGVAAPRRRSRFAMPVDRANGHQLDRQKVYPFKPLRHASAPPFDDRKIVEAAGAMTCARVTRS